MVTVLQMADILNCEYQAGGDSATLAKVAACVRNQLDPSEAYAFEHVATMGGLTFGPEDLEMGTDPIEVPGPDAKTIQIEGYPYDADDRVMLGISTWQHPLTQNRNSAHGPRGPFTRYFVPASVIANDRKAMRLVVKCDDRGDQRLESLHWWEFNGEEVVAYDESLPQTPEDAHRRALKGEVF